MAGFSLIQAHMLLRHVMGHHYFELVETSKSLVKNRVPVLESVRYSDFISVLQPTIGGQSFKELNKASRIGGLEKKLGQKKKNMHI